MPGHACSSFKRMHAHIPASSWFFIYWIFSRFGLFVIKSVSSANTLVAFFSICTAVLQRIFSVFEDLQSISLSKLVFFCLICMCFVKVSRFTLSWPPYRQRSCQVTQRRHQAEKALVTLTQFSKANAASPTQTPGTECVCHQAAGNGGKCFLKFNKQRGNKPGDSC